MAKYSFIDLGVQLIRRQREYSSSREMGKGACYATPEQIESKRQELDDLRIEFDMRKSELDAKKREGMLSDGDLTAAMAPLENLQRKIDEISYLLSNAKIINDAGEQSNVVQVLSTVRIQNVSTNQVMDIVIGGQDSPISVESPFGKALLGKPNGDIVVVNAPAGTLKFKILAINGVPAPEKLPNEPTPSDTKVTRTSPAIEETVEPIPPISIPEHSSFEDLVELCVEEDDNVINYVVAYMVSRIKESGKNIDRILAALKRCNDIIYERESELKDIENRIKAKSSEESALVLDKMQEATNRKAILDYAVSEYLNAIGKKDLSGEKYSVSIKDSTTYALSADVKDSYIKTIRDAGIPDWLDIELEPNQDVLSQMEDMPKGVFIENEEREIGVFANGGMNPILSPRERYIEGWRNHATIKTMADESDASYRDVFYEIVNAWIDGDLSQEDIISDDELERVQQYKAESPHAPVWEISNQTGVSYDRVVVSLSYLSRIAR